MKSLGSWLIAIFTGLFWLFRVAIAFMSQYGKDFGGFIVFNSTIEIVLLFVAILCIILFIKRVLLGGVILLIGYGYYFGGYIISTGLPAILSGSIPISVMQNTFVAAIGLGLAFAIMANLILARVKRKDPKDKKTDWFFQNEEYDRKLDERADKNQYRNY